MEQKSGSTSRKGEKIKSYTVDFKLEAIAFAKSCNNKAAARKFNVAPKTIRDWIRKEEAIASDETKPRLWWQTLTVGGWRSTCF